MQQFKPKFPRAANAPRPAEKQAEKSPEKKGGIREIICPDNYSPIWQQAFALADNVRFTRTPDSEIRRRRAAIDPAYARILAEAEEARKQAEIAAASAEEAEETAPDDMAAESAAAPEGEAMPAPDFRADEAEESAPANQGHDRIEQMREYAEAAFAPSPAPDFIDFGRAESEAAEAMPPHNEADSRTVEQPQMRTESEAESAPAPRAAEYHEYIAPAEESRPAPETARHTVEMPRNPVMNAQSFAAACQSSALSDNEAMPQEPQAEIRAEAAPAAAEKAKTALPCAFPWAEMKSADEPAPASEFFRSGIAPRAISAAEADFAPAAPQAAVFPPVSAEAASPFQPAGGGRPKIYWIPVPAEAVENAVPPALAAMPSVPPQMPAAAPIPAMAMPPLMAAAYGFGAMAGFGGYGAAPARAAIAPAQPAAAPVTMPPAAQSFASAPVTAEPKADIQPRAQMSWTKPSAARPVMRVNLADYDRRAASAAKPQAAEPEAVSMETAAEQASAPVPEVSAPVPETAPIPETAAPAAEAAAPVPEAVIPESAVSETVSEPAPAAPKPAFEAAVAVAAPMPGPEMSVISVKANLAQEDLDRLCSTAVEKTERHTVPPRPQAQMAQPATAEAAPAAAQAELLKPHPLPQAQVRPVARYSYALPSLDFLQEPVYNDGSIISQETLERSAGLLESVLEDFGVKGEIIHVRPGPVVTLYEFEPAPGVKSSRVIGLADDIARSMSSVSARVAVIPGRNVIGIELPNKTRETVYLREILNSKAYKTSEYKLPLALGKNIGGEPIIAELAKMPHLLVAGTTGSGKSVAINTMILSLLYRMPPSQCRLIMVDPKMLELSIYDGIPHLLTPVVTDPKKALSALKWAVREMEERYRKMAKLGVRNIDGFNARVKDAAHKGETIMCTVQAGFDKETGELLYTEEAMDLTPLPYIVIIVDEMADLMMVAGKEIEGAIQRLAQMARAAGIHLIMATQRPSVDVITGTIKANFPTRISFQVTSKIDSRTILGEQGAETLLGQGDMLHMAGGGRLKRVHGPFVSDREVEKVVAHLKTQGTPEYLATVTESNDEDEEEETSVAEIVAAAAAGSGDDFEELYIQAVKVVMRDKKCSTSYIQRRLGIGYNKAASLVEKMEVEGLVGEANHVGKREILVNSA